MKNILKILSIIVLAGQFLCVGAVQNTGKAVRDSMYTVIGRSAAGSLLALGIVPSAVIAQQAAKSAFHEYHAYRSANTAALDLKELHNKLYSNSSSHEEMDSKKEFEASESRDKVKVAQAEYARIKNSFRANARHAGLFAGQVVALGVCAYYNFGKAHEAYNAFNK
ncbi:MAG: hypothetical protein WC707_05240 [Candidatus Babeliaceae bacterium]